MPMSRTVLLMGALIAACGPDEGGSTDAATQPQITTAQATDPGGDDSSTAATTTATTTAQPTTDASTTSPSGTTGALEDTGASSAGEVTTDDLKFDMGPLPDVPPPVCLKCALTIESKQSGTFAIEGQSVFATAQLAGQVVYAIGTHGAGRFIAAADSSLPLHEVTDCPLSEWLAANGGLPPRVMIFGWGPSDGSPDVMWDPQYDVFGIHLPEKYIGSPALLRQDYDIVMYLEGSGQFDMGDQPADTEVATVLDYLTMGGGAYISSEFYGYLNDADLISVNRLLQPLGVTSQAVSLNWGNVDGNIDFECFPEPQ